VARALSIAAGEVARSGGSFKLLRQSLSQRLASGDSCTAECASPVT